MWTEITQSTPPVQGYYHVKNNEKENFGFAYWDGRKWKNLTYTKCKNMNLMSDVITHWGYMNQLQNKTLIARREIYGIYS